MKNQKASPEQVAKYYKKLYLREVDRHGETLQKLGACEYLKEQLEKRLKGWIQTQ
jgi:hypothetical protein